MSKLDTLDKLVEDNLGYLKASEAVDAGISRSYIAEYVKAQGMERVAEGLYLASDAWPDGMYVIQARYPQAVFSHETAMYLLDMAEREPTRYTITLKAGTNVTKLTEEGVKVYKVKRDLFEVGLTEARSPFGHMLRTYNAERTLCDVIRSRNNIEIQDFQVAIKEYMQRKDKNIPRLMEYAELFSVDKIVMRYLEVML
jgi:hypothetical protein